MNVTETVARQYTDWAYPKPIPDMAEAIARGTREADTPSLVTPVLWPEGRSMEGLKILIAGCGTNQGAYYAMMVPQAEVIGIDLSLTSLQHEKYLIGKHEIKNLTLHHMSLLDIGKLNETYDFIVCCGVLHHLDDPDAGLRALRDVLRTDGIMSVMVYAPYLRQGVYMLQQAFRILDIAQTRDGVELVRHTLKNLPERHWANFYIRNAPDISYDAGIVDTFLHPQDRSYTVRQVLDFARNNALDFWDWVEPAMYSCKAAFPANHALKYKIGALPEEDRWTIVELLTQKFGFHQLFLCHPSRRAKRIDFAQFDWESFVPVFRPGLKIVETTDPSQDESIRLRRKAYAFGLKKAGATLIKLANGRLTILEITNLARAKIPELRQEGVRGFFASMHELGHLMYWRSAPPQN
jgi:SAM-dependent methyltransferase